MNLVINGRLITRDEGGKGYYEHGAVAYEGATITEVGQESALRAKYPQAHIIDAKGGFFQLELADDARLRRDLWDRCGDDTLRGLFLRRLRQEYDAADPRRQKEIEQAVRFGLAAMDNKEL